MIFHKILAPTDLSEPSFRALRRAMLLAEGSGAELTLLRVLSNADIASGDTDLETEQQHLDDVVRDYAPADLVVKTMVCQGDITGEILRAAKDGDFDLIVMATHGSSGWREFVLGSITGEVVRMATCPVFTISNFANSDNATTPLQEVQGRSDSDTEETQQGLTLTFKKIVCPLDFSPTSYDALENAEQLARHIQGELILVHVVPYPAPNDQGFKSEEEAFDFASKNAETQLQLIIATHLSNIKDVRFTILSGSPAGQLVADVARDEKADMIILGTHGWTGWRRLVLGSVTEDVMHLADCPVLTVHSSTVDFAADGSALKILCPVDFSEPSLQALETAGKMAVSLDGELSLLHVMESVSTAFGELSAKEFLQMRSDAAVKAMVPLIKKHLSVEVQDSAQSNRLTRRGRPGAEIVRAAEEGSFDLVVMSTRGETDWRRLLVGSITTEVVRTAPCPVLTVGHGARPGTDATPRRQVDEVIEVPR